MRLIELMESQHTDSMTLYRGMSLDEYHRIEKTHMYIPNPMNPHNDATTNLDTARYYASEKVHDEQGVVIQFNASLDSVKHDSIFHEDYKILKPINIVDFTVI